MNAMVSPVLPLAAVTHDEGVILFAKSYGVQDNLFMDTIEIGAAVILAARHHADGIGQAKTIGQMKDALGCKSKDALGNTVYNKPMLAAVAFAAKLATKVSPIFGEALVAVMTLTDIRARIEQYRIANGIKRMCEYRSHVAGEAVASNGSAKASVGKALLDRLNNKASEITDLELTALAEKIAAVVSGRAVAAEKAKMDAEEAALAAQKALDDASELEEFRAWQAKAKA